MLPHLDGPTGAEANALNSQNTGIYLLNDSEDIYFICVFLPLFPTNGVTVCWNSEELLSDMILIPNIDSSEF